MRIRESQFERATELFFEAAAVPEFWPSALQAVANACAALGVNLLPVGPGREDVVCSPSIQAYMDDVLASGWVASNPYMRRGMELTAAGRRGLISSEEMLTPEEASRDPYINEHRQPGGLGPEAGVLLVNTRELAVPITFVRARGKEPFSRTEIGKMNRLVGTFKPAANLALQVGLSVSRRLLDSFSSDGRQLALLGAGEKVLHLSPGFEAHLGHALTLRAGQLGSWHAHSDQILAGALKRVVSVGPVTDRTTVSFALPRRGRRPLIAQALPICGQGQDAFMLARGMLILTDPDVVNPVEATSVALGAMGLSQAEARLARRIGAGEDLKSIAEAEGITIETARTRLKSVFSKTGTHRQAELAVLVASLRS